MHWYQKAVNQGLAPVQNSLGVMYAFGEGVPEDNVKAYAWISMTAAQGTEKAKENKELIAKVMTRAEITKVQELSREFWEAYGPAH